MPVLDKPFFSEMLVKLISSFRRQILVVLIVAFAFGIRVSNTSLLPPALNWDEISHGYNAYAILRTGRDEWGAVMPAIFRAYGDYKLPVYIYLTTISEFFLGLSPLAVRLPSILAGTGSVLFTYLLVRRLFSKEKIAITAALLMAVEPWSFFISRVAAEANLAVFFIIAATYFWVESLSVGLKKSNLMIWSVIFWGLSVWTYNSARVFTPLFLLTLIVIYHKELLTLTKKQKRLGIVLGVLALALFTPMFFQLFNTQGQARYGWVQILDEGAIAEIVNYRQTLNLPGILPRLLSNKVTYFIRAFAWNYLAHFSPEYLFWEGGSHYQFSIPGHGLLYLINLPFFVFGIAALVKNVKTKSHQLILAWLILSPVAASMTREAPHALRSIIILPIPMILAAFGLFTFVGLFKKLAWQKVILSVYIILLAGSIESYATKLADYQKNYSWAWQYGYQEVVDILRSKYLEYDQIIVSKKYGEPHEFLLFFWPWDPQAYQSDPRLVRFFQSNWYWVDAFDKFTFVNDWQVPLKGQYFVSESGLEIDCQARRCLLVAGPENYPRDWQKMESIKFLSGQEAFGLYQN